MEICISLSTTCARRTWAPANLLSQLNVLTVSVAPPRALPLRMRWICVSCGYTDLVSGVRAVKWAHCPSKNITVLASVSVSEGEHLPELNQRGVVRTRLARARRRDEYA